MDTPSGYTGKRNTTVSGMPCYRWDSPDVLKYGYTDLQYYPEANLTEAQNYCRNPESTFYEPWCFNLNQTNEDDWWEYCDVKKCEYY